VKKFPVTTEDGREFRVTVSCGEHSLSSEIIAVVKLYVERKDRRFFRFKRVFVRHYGRDDGYDWKKPDFVALTARAITNYDDAVGYAAELSVRVAQRDRDIADAHAAFNAWDGRLTDGRY
jgi:hypothetical protein